MRLTQYTDYSLRVLMYLALKGDRRSTINEITEAYGISRNHLMKVVQQLSRQGYIETSRGPGGGVQLKKHADEIHLGQVVRDVESDPGLVECFRPGSACVIESSCLLPALLSRAVNAFLAELDQSTLADLLTPPADDALTGILKIRE